MKNFLNKSSDGIASLPILMALTILIVAVAVGITTLSITESLSSFGQKKSGQALLYAETGARDALLRIARNKSYTCATEDCYSLDMVSAGCSSNAGCVSIRVSAGVGSSADPKIIVSKGQVRSNIRRLQVSVIFDTASNGEIATTTWTELTN